MSNWYLNRYKNSQSLSRTKRSLSQPPYHVHPKYEDKLKELEEKVNQSQSQNVDELKQKIEYVSEQLVIVADNVKAISDYMALMDERLKALEKK